MGVYREAQTRKGAFLELVGVQVMIAPLHHIVSGVELQIYSVVSLSTYTRSPRLVS